ncbi:nck-associated protein 5-like [Eudromia elegans]
MAEWAAEAPGAGSAAVDGDAGASHELLQRLRELEAENSALAQANENQRETYERCLDEVANHVVQALLNQKDLREECVKLKRRVSELERQNQALRELLQQKLQLPGGPLPQPLPAPPDAPSSPRAGPAEPPPPPPPPCCGPPAQASPVGVPGTASAAPALAALSPFLRKQARILEALRSLGQPEAPAEPASPGSSPEEPPGPPRGALLSALAERLLRGAERAAEPGHVPFKERLAALGKAPAPGGSLRHAEAAAPEPLARCYSSGSVGARHDGDGKGAAKSRAGGTAKAPRSPRGGSPTKAPAGKAGKADEAKAAAPAGSRKAPGSAGGTAAASAAHSAIEAKVMKGIEENVLRLQGQERAAAAAAAAAAAGGEAKGRAAGGLASWFGLRRSKLPALSRRAEAAKGREGSRAAAAAAAAAARRLDADGLNISRLMEKAEDLRKALQEEQALLQGLARDKGRPRAPGALQLVYHEVAAETFMQQLLHRVDGKDVSLEGRLEHKRELRELQRLAPPGKEPRLCRPPRNGLVGHARGCAEPPAKGPALRDELPSDESLSESGTSQRFPACGSLTRTLDSGIGTFPPPDSGGGAAAARSAPRPRARAEPGPGAPRAPRRARTLEREAPGADGPQPPGKHRSMPAFPGAPTGAEPPAPRGGRPQGARTGADGGSPEPRAGGAAPRDPPGLQRSGSLSDSLYDSLSSCGSQG